MLLLGPLLGTAYQPLDRNLGERFTDQFQRDRFVTLSGFFSGWAYQLIKAEGIRLAGQATRRDIFMEESQSWRHMTTIGSRKLCSLSSIIPFAYESPDLLAFLSAIAGEQVAMVPDENEMYALNCLTKAGDSHGSHVDDYSFALNILVEAPIEGGVVQILGEKGQEAGRQEVREITLCPSDVYFMRTDLAIHRVSPITGSGRRIAFNFAYKAERDKKTVSYSSSKLYS